MFWVGNTERELIDLRKYDLLMQKILQMSIFSSLGSAKCCGTVHLKVFIFE